MAELTSHLLIPAICQSGLPETAESIIRFEQLLSTFMGIRHYPRENPNKETFARRREVAHFRILPPYLFPLSSKQRGG